MNVLAHLVLGKTLLQPGLNSQCASAHAGHGCKQEPAGATEAPRGKLFVIKAAAEREIALKPRNVWVWWHMPFIPAFGRLRQRNLLSWSPEWFTQRVPGQLHSEDTHWQLGIF